MLFGRPDVGAGIDGLPDAQRQKDERNLLHLGCHEADQRTLWKKEEGETLWEWDDDTPPPVFLMARVFVLFWNVVTVTAFPLELYGDGI